MLSSARLCKFRVHYTCVYVVNFLFRFIKEFCVNITVANTLDSLQDQKKYIKPWKHID